MASDAERAFAALSRTRNLLFRHAAQPVREAGLTLTQFEVLEALDAHGPLRVGELERAIFGTPGNVGYVVGRLADEGLVSRGRAADDGRACVVALTEEGARRVRAVYPQVVASLERDLAPLGAQGREGLTRLLHQVLDAAGAAGEG